MIEKRNRAFAYQGGISLGFGLLAGFARAIGAHGDRVFEAGLFGALAGFGLVTLLGSIRGRTSDLERVSESI